MEISKISVRYYQNAYILLHVLDVKYVSVFWYFASCASQFLLLITNQTAQMLVYGDKSFIIEMKIILKSFLVENKE